MQKSIYRIYLLPQELGLTAQASSFMLRAS